MNQISARLFARVLAAGTLACILSAPSARAQFANYFNNQLFSNATSALAGTYNGGTYSISAPAGATVNTWASSITTGLPAGSNFPAPGPTGFTMTTASTFRTVVVSFSTPLTPADHIYICDADINEFHQLSFRDAQNNVINTTGFTARALSNNFSNGFSLVNNGTTISITGSPSNDATPVVEVIPNTAVSSISIYYNSNGGGGTGYLFARNRPLLTQGLSTSNISPGSTATLSYTLSGINNNPLSDLGFTNTLPSGWVVAANPAATASLGTITAVPGSNTVTVSGVNNSFSAATPVTAATYSVAVTSASGFTSSSCSGNPAASTNSTSNFATDGTQLQNSTTPVCMTVTIPLPLKLLSFEAGTAGCAARLDWQMASDDDSRAFRIERSADGKTWQTLGTIAALPAQRSYSYTDRSAASGRQYYRLQLSGTGGETGYSATVSVQLDCSTTQSLRVHPVPATGRLHIEVPGGEPATALLCALDGRAVRQASLAGNGSLDVSGLAPGTYSLSVRTATSVYQQTVTVGAE